MFWRDAICYTFLIRKAHIWIAICQQTASVTFLTPNFKNHRKINKTSYITVFGLITNKPSSFLLKWKSFKNTLKDTQNVLEMYILITMSA